MSTRLTLVTGFWDPAALGRDVGRRPGQVYLRLFTELHRTVPWPIVAWVDPRWADAVRAIVAAGAPAPRHVVPRSVEDLPHAPERDALGTLRPFDNHDPSKDTLGFSVATWSKPDLVVDAMRLDGCSGARWAWIDFGIAHVADLGGIDWQAIARVAPERVRLCTMRATAAAEVEDRAEFYRLNRGRMAAGFFTGSGPAMVDLRARFHAELGRMRGTGRRGLDEQVLAVLLACDPGNFERWYADYAGILANYVAIRRDVGTILAGLADCRARGLWAIGTDVARRLLDAMREEHVLLTPAQTACLLHDAFICAFYEDRPFAERVARILSALYHYGNEEFRRTLDAWQPLVEQNLRHVGLDLARPAWRLTELLAQPDLACWRVCL